jgi:hypothetical protein
LTQRKTILETTKENATMRLIETLEIRTGCKLLWSDPDGGECSRTIVVEKAFLNYDETMLIECQDGTTLHCLPAELAWA